MERMDVKEAAEYIGSSVFKTYELVRKKEIPHYRIGSRILFRKEALDAWIAQQEQENCRAAK